MIQRFSKILCLFILSLIAPLFGLGQLTFTNIAGVGADASDIGFSKDGGCSFADYDLDGDLDLIVNTNDNTSTRRSYLLRNDDGVFTDVTTTVAPGLKTTGITERSAAWGDCNNDGYPDLMVNSHNRFKILINNSGSSFTLHTHSTSITNGMNTEGVGWLDHDNDGDLDYFVENDEHGIDLFVNDGSTPTPVFTQVTIDAVGAAGTGAGGFGLPEGGSSDGDYAASVDLNNDGYVDIIARRRNDGTNDGMDNNPYDIFLNDGDGTYTPHSSFNEYGNNADKGAILSGDFDNDGDFDIIWTSGTTDANRLVLYENTGDNSMNFLMVANPFKLEDGTTNTDTDSEGAAMADIDNDGDLDVFVSRNGGGAGFLYLNNSTGQGNFDFRQPGPTWISGAAVNYGISISASGEGVVFADFDNDGDEDLYVNRDGSVNQLWRNDLIGSTTETEATYQNNYLRIITEIDLGSGIYRAAINATVKLLDCDGNSLAGIREIGSGGAGHGSQTSPWLHFGLPYGPDYSYLVEVQFTRNGTTPVVVRKKVTPSDLAVLSLGSSSMDLEQTLLIRDTDTSDSTIPFAITCQDITTGIIPGPAVSDGSIGGVINDYSAVSMVGTNSVTVASAAAFSANDKVILMQMKGAAVSAVSNDEYGSISDIGSAGLYEYKRIRSVSGNSIEFMSDIGNSYEITGVVQLIRVPEYDDVTITSTLQASPWDGTTGGVLALHAEGTVTMNADIDVSGLGFRGGDVSTNYYIGCRDWGQAYSFSYPTGLAGQKGEGAVVVSAGSGSGRGKMANGGGGGGYTNAGGGGGSNIGTGGLGGREWSGCNQPYGGIGGQSLSAYLTSTRVFLGGGGGGGQQNNSVSSDGGHGGGIIFLKADELVSNGNDILAAGSAALNAAHDGAGGGGGGGSVLLDISTVPVVLDVFVNGGSGGNASGGHGPAGGGGGGMLWHSGASLLANINVDFSGGLNGTSTGSYGAEPGTDGATRSELTLPCTDFFFVPPEDMVASTVGDCGLSHIDADQVYFCCSGGASYTVTNTAYDYSGSSVTCTSGITVAEICNNGIDDDCDGYADCADSDCVGGVICPDNDGDGVADALDLDDDNDGIPDVDEKDCTSNSALDLSALTAINPELINHAVSGHPSSTLFSGDITVNHTSTTASRPEGQANGDLRFGNESNLENSEYRFVFDFPTSITLSQAEVSGAFEQLETWTITTVGGVLTVSNPTINVITSNGTNWNDSELDLVSGDGTRHLTFSPKTHNADGNISVADSEWNIKADEVTELILNVTMSNGSTNVTRMKVSTSCSAIDTDGDGVPDHIDLDSDNDGIFDLIEAGHGAADTNEDGVIDGSAALFGINGLFDGLETVLDNGVLNFTVLDSDADGNIDAIELDSDNDGCNDVIEAGFIDQDGDGVLGN